MSTNSVSFRTGVDSDRGRVTVAVLEAITQVKIAASSFPTTARGDRQILRWATSIAQERPRAWLFKGAGLSMTLLTAGELVMDLTTGREPASTSTWNTHHRSLSRATPNCAPTTTLAAVIDP